MRKHRTIRSTLINNIVKKVMLNTNIKNGILFTFFSFLNNGINFLLLLILAAYLSPDSYGKLNLFTTAVSLLAMVIPLSTTGYVGVSFFKKKNADFKQVINNVLLVSMSMLILCGIISLLIKDQIQNIIGFSVEYQIIILLICFFQVFNLVNLDIWRLEEKPIKYGIYSFGIVLANFSLTLFLIISFKMDWVGRVYAQLAVAIIFFAISIVFLFYRKLLVFNTINKHILKETLSFGVPLIPHQISGWLRQGVDRYIINFFLGTAYVAFFSFAYNIVNIIVIVGMAFNASNSVNIYKQLSNETAETKFILLRQIKQMSFFFFLFTLLTIIIGYVTIKLFFSNYNLSIGYLIPLCFAGMFQCIYFLFVNFLFYFRKTTILMYITFTVSFLHLFTSYLLTRYSVIYTVYISLISSFLICLLVVIYTQKIYKIFAKRELIN